MSDDERAVLGDELIQRGDPLGELINLALALERLAADVPPVRRNLIERKRAALLDQHHDALFGPLAPHTPRLSLPDLRDPALVVKQWRGGFADVVWVQSRIAGPTVESVIRELRELPIARFVRRIEIGAGDHAAAITAVADLPTLRELVIGDRSRRLPQLVAQPITDARLIEPLVGRLEVLQLFTPLELPRMASTTLRTYQGFRTTEPFVAPTIRFEATLPALEELQLYGYLFDRDLLARYPRLRRLTLSGHYEAGWMEHSLMSPAIEHLEEMMLSHTFRDDDLRAIERHAQRLARVKLLDLRGNAFGNDIRGQIVLPRCVRI